MGPAHGAVKSMTSKRTGRQLVVGSSPHAYGNDLYEGFHAIQVAAIHIVLLIP
jgi:hypothetical protein